MAAERRGWPARPAVSATAATPAFRACERLGAAIAPAARRAQNPSFETTSKGVEAGMTAPSTSSLHGARDHARSQAGRGGADRRSHDPGPDRPSLWDETVGVGGYAGRRLPRGAVLRIADDVGDACVHLVVFNADSPAERLNVADTVKVQWQAYLGPGALLLSDMGRVLMTIVADTSARHDALCGRRTGRGQRRPGTATGRSARRHPSARDLLVLAGAKHGLERRDLPDRHQPVQAGRRRRRRGAHLRRRPCARRGRRAAGRDGRHRARWPTSPTRSTPAPEYLGSPVRVSAAARRAARPTIRSGRPRPSASGRSRTPTTSLAGAR